MKDLCGTLEALVVLPVATNASSMFFGFGGKLRLADSDFLVEGFAVLLYCRVPQVSIWFLLCCFGKKNGMKKKRKNEKK
jgi:hypothetical protein